MTTQTPDAVREAAEEARNLLKSAQMASDGRRVTLHPTRARLVYDRLAAALESRAGDEGEEERARQFVERLDGWRFYNRAEFDLALFKGAQLIEAMIGFARSEAAATPAPAVDAVPAGEDGFRVAVEIVNAAADRLAKQFPMGSGAESALRAASLDISSAALSHGEGRK